MYWLLKLEKSRGRRLQVRLEVLPQMIASGLTFSPSLHASTFQVPFFLSLPLSSRQHIGCQKLQTHSLIVSSPGGRQKDSFPISLAKVLG